MSEGSHCTPIVTAAAPTVAAEPTRNLRLVIACARIERPIVRLLHNPCPTAVRALRLTERGVAAYRLRDEVSNVWLTTLPSTIAGVSRVAHHAMTSKAVTHSACRLQS